MESHFPNKITTYIVFFPTHENKGLSYRNYKLLGSDFIYIRSTLNKVLKPTLALKHMTGMWHTGPSTWLFLKNKPFWSTAPRNASLASRASFRFQVRRKEAEQFLWLVTFNISIFKQVIRVNYQVGIFFIALTSFCGAFQSSLGELN